MELLGKILGKFWKKKTSNDEKILMPRVGLN